MKLTLLMLNFEIYQFTLVEINKVVIYLPQYAVFHGESEFAIRIALSLLVQTLWLSKGKRGTNLAWG
jgi:hypothetical protein